MMNWSFLFFFNSVLLGAGLAMDAFSVSLANGLNEPGMSRKKMLGIAGTFAFFQALMPLAGWILVHTIVQRLRAAEKWIPWIALFLLLSIGGKMIWDSLRRPASSDSVHLGAAALAVQGFATSVDALSVGFTIADYALPMALVCAAIIALVTFLLCLGGILLGRRFGAKLAGGASLLGGIILIAIGIEIFITGLLS